MKSSPTNPDLAQDVQSCLLIKTGSPWTQELPEAVAALLQKADCPVLQVSGEISDKAAIEEACKQGRRRIIAAGGDGFIHWIASAIIAVQKASCVQRCEELELAVVPLGTGNDLARSLGIPTAAAAALELALAGSATPIDIARFAHEEEGLFFNALSLGIGATIVQAADSDMKDAIGPAAYWAQVLRVLTEAPAYDVKIHTGEGEIETSIHGLMIANGRFAGGGFPISHTAILNDGLLDLTIVPQQSVVGNIRAALELLLEQHEDSQQILTARSRRIEIELASPAPVNVDGETIEGGVAGITVEVLPKAVRAVAAAEAPAIAIEG